MGCFDSTCAITRTPIHHGDQILMVSFVGTKDQASTYDFYTVLSEYRLNLQDEKYMNRKAESTAKVMQDQNKFDVERFKKLQIEYYTQEMNHEIPSVFGEYNDYGWVEDYPHLKGREDEDFFTFYIHKEVVDEICGCDSSTMDRLSMLLAVVRFASWSRIQLFGNFLLGEQYGVYSKEEEKRHAQMIAMMQKMHDKQYRLDEE